MLLPPLAMAWVRLHGKWTAVEVIQRDGRVQASEDRAWQYQQLSRNRGGQWGCDTGPGLLAEARSLPSLSSRSGNR